MNIGARPRVFGGILLRHRMRARRPSEPADSALSKIPRHRVVPRVFQSAEKVGRLGSGGAMAGERDFQVEKPGGETAEVQVAEGRTTGLGLPGRFGIAALAV